MSDNFIFIVCSLSLSLKGLLYNNPLYPLLTTIGADCDKVEPRGDLLKREFDGMPTNPSFNLWQEYPHQSTVDVV